MILDKGDLISYCVKEEGKPTEVALGLVLGDSNEDSEGVEVYWQDMAERQFTAFEDNDRIQLVQRGKK